MPPTTQRPHCIIGDHPLRAALRLQAQASGHKWEGGVLAGTEFWLKEFDHAGSCAAFWNPPRDLEVMAFGCIGGGGVKTVFAEA
eukprot:727185-Amphidinium_carterae.1